MTRHGGEEAPPDHQFVIAAQAGDRAAFDALVLRYRVRIEGFLRRKVGDVTVAGDLAQDTFDEAYDGLSGLHEPAAFRSWLYNIAAAQAFMYYRWRRRFATVPLFASPHVDGPSPMRLTIEEALSEMTDVLRSVLLMHDVAGYTVREIANFLGISKEATQKRLYRARAAFRKRYADDTGLDD